MYSDDDTLYDDLVSIQHLSMVDIFDQTSWRVSCIFGKGLSSPIPGRCCFGADPPFDTIF